MNKLTKVVVLLVALVASLSFSQESSLVSSAEQKERSTICDTALVNRAVLNNATVEALKASQTFYSNSFDWLLSILAIVVAVLIFVNVISMINMDKKMKYLLKDQRISFKRRRDKQEKKLEESFGDKEKSFQSELKVSIDKISKIKEEIDTALDNDRKNTCIKFDDSFRLQSGIYAKEAEDSLGKGAYYKYFKYMYLFYTCLLKIEKLEIFDIERLHFMCELLSEKELTGIINKPEDKKDFCRLLVTILEFIKQRNDSSWNPVDAKLTYSALCNLKMGGFSTNDEICKEIGICMRHDKRTEEEIDDILRLANYCITDMYSI